MNRREFLRDLAIASTLVSMPAGLLGDTHTIQASLEIDSQDARAAVPANFTGLSYESAQLGNPEFFSGFNTQLIELFRSLGKEGVLRLGGGTSEFTQWSAEETHVPAPFDSFGPDTSKRVKTTVTITPKAIRNLRAFLDATGWQLLYGLKVARGTPQEAAEEAEFVQQTIGPRMFAFQLGNEPDAWRNRYRPASWGFTDYFAVWKQFHDAIVKQAPQARFAGPDVSNHMDWVVQFAEHARDEIVLLTGHYYAEGPATSPKATMDRLLSPNPRLDKNLTEIMQAARATHLPYRMSEGNSCWDGGKPGVSDTLGSALWAADMMLQFAQAGCAGVNLHGGGDGFYTPIAGGLHEGFTRRPEFYGMQFAENFSGSTFTQSRLTSPSDRLSAYVAKKNEQMQLAIVNKGTADIAVSMKDPLLPMQNEIWVLGGPSLESKQHVAIRQRSVHRSKQRTILAPAHSAVLYEFPT